MVEWREGALCVTNHCIGTEWWTVCWAISVMTKAACDPWPYWFSSHLEEAFNWFQEKEKDK